MTTPNLGMDEWPSGSFQASAPINADLQLIDALMRPGGRVQDKDLTTPPTTVLGDVGKTWIIPSGATGVWSGRTGQIALCTAAVTWRFFTPAEGWQAYVLDEDIDYKYNGSTWVTAGAVTSVNGDSGAVLVPTPFGVACSDLVTDLTTGTTKGYFRAPFAMENLTYRASLVDPSSSGVVTVDINKNGSTILSTKLTIDATEKTSTTAATPYVATSTTCADDDEYTIDIDGAGTDAKGLIVWFIGNKT